MYLGKIINSKGKITTFPFIEVTSTFNPEEEQKEPVLIIGKSLTESFYPNEKLKILDRKIKDNVFWAFSKHERRDDFEECVKSFEKAIFDNAIKTQCYYFVNLLTKGYKTAKKCINLLRNSQKKFCFVTEKHVFIYYPLKDITIGFSLSDIEYIGIDKMKILGKIKENNSNIIITNTDFLGNRLENIIGNKIYLVPYIYFLLKN